MAVATRATTRAPQPAQHAKRTASRLKVAGAVIIRGQGSDGKPYLLVLTANEPERGYVVARDKKTQAWTCTCFTARWRRTCAHLEAVEAAEEAEDESREHVAADDTEVGHGGA
ncbi:MAG: hypothetical protein ACRDJN_20990 [Chloroflexota bacterium]